MNKHPHEEVILAYYRGEQIEWRFNDGEAWRPLALYHSNKPGLEIAPSFDYDIQYRIKPKTYAVELTKEEIETIWAVLMRVSGCPQKSARAHVDSARSKLGQNLDTFRANTLDLWGGITGGMGIGKRLPE